MVKNMNLKNKLTSILIVFVVFYLYNTNLYAAKKRGVYATKNLIGQEYYMNRCSSCHGEGSRGGNMASIREWQTIFSKDAIELSEIHFDDDQTHGLLEYIKSKEFKKESKQILSFLQEFAYDSENIPTCN